MMHGSTFTLRPSRFNCQNAKKISLFFSLSPFSLSHFFALPSLFPFFSFLFFFLSTRTPFSYLFHPYLFSIFILFFHLLYSLYFHFLFSHSIFSSFFSFSPPSRLSYQYGSSGGNFPPLSSLATCQHHVFLPYFHYFLFPFYYIM